MSAHNAVLFKRYSEHIAVVTINRPDAMNAINDEVARDLERYVQQTEAEEDIWVTVLTGAGQKAFSAGADLKMISQGRGRSLSTEEGGFGGFVRAARSKPWIAAVGGYALAGGFELALACDMIVASEKAKFGLPEVTRGITAAAGGLFRLTRLIPRPLAVEMITTGKIIDAQRAYQLGLLNRVVPQEDYLEEALALAEKIAGNAPLAVKASLKVIQAAWEMSEKELFELSLAEQIKLMRSEDAQEGPRAFVEKRKPAWKGR